MKHILLTAAAMAVIFSASPAMSLGLGEAGELEHARANARAGGPLSERDRELLERWGCLSGTDNAFCARLEGRGPYYVRDRHHHHRHKHHRRHR